MDEIERRKIEHIKIAIKKEAQAKENYFDYIYFLHSAIPKEDISNIKIETKFLKKRIKPFMITAITGGFKKAEKINKALAKVAEEENIAFGVGSQRIMLQDKNLKYSYYVRDVAPNVLLIGNIGIAQLLKYKPEEIEAMAKDIDADAIAVHFNILQEILQIEGDKKLSGFEEKLTELSELIPVIAKETGCGISREVALKLKECKVKAIDVSGYGGTSWAKVEILRRKMRKQEVEEDLPFEEWGIPTPLSILEAKASGLPIIASGGIRNGVDAAKAIALGATIAGAAKPFIEAFVKNGEEGVRKKVKIYLNQLKKTIFLVGCKDVKELSKKQIIVTGKLKDFFEARGYLR
ncbi:MAG: type 2 isopentenyl-diphosphate Delta-isomerase [Candidatus Micrarchaeales archaeon]